MFQSAMSPKMLNVDKLEKKFASLTRSRESIQSLSMWIIRHKDLYKEIVNHWLDALTRDFNALTMFYVANDVIQNCGRKKAPEFREAFASVLEKAVSLEKVKEIKTEVIRMLTLWHDRSIYDDEFFKKLEVKINAAVVDCESEKEEELSEADVIANFKLENVINSLKKLQTLEDELHEKETFLEDIEEPGMCNIDNLIVKMDSQKEVRKFDKFQKLVEECISLTDKVIAAKKAALLNLKYSSIFYNAQMEDAKKVAHAYRIYGKKVKILEKSLSEKISTLPEEPPHSPESGNPSPYVELNSSHESLNISMICAENDKSGSQENNLEIINPKMIESEFNISPSGDCTAIVDAEISIDEEEEEEETKETLCSSSDDMAKGSSEVTESATAPKIAEQSLSNKTSLTESQALPDIECIDFLLEKAYDDQVKGSKLSFKRKIDNLLKLKQAKACKLANEEDSVNDSKISSESVPSNKISQSTSSDSQMQTSLCTVSNEYSPLEAPKSFVSKEESNCNRNNPEKDGSSPNSIVVDSKSVNAAEKISQPPDVLNDVQSTRNAEKISNFKQTESFKDTVEVVQDTQASNENESKNVLSSNSFIFQTLPDIPTELLKNILNKHRINMNSSSNVDASCINISALTSVSKHTAQPNSSPNDVKTTSENHSLVGKFSDNSSINSEVKSVCQELLVGDNTSNANIKSPLLVTPSLSAIDNIKDNHKVNSTIFLENLQNVLECFTKKEASFKKLNCSKTVSPLTSMPLENTLRVFNCIMQNCKKVDGISSKPLSTSNFNGNSVPYLPSEGFTNNEEFCSIERNHNSQGTFLIKEASCVTFNKNDKCIENFAANAKNDNLEIIDMEVDSEDENSE